MTDSGGNTLGGKVGLDTTDAKTRVQEFNREIRLLESAFQAASSGLADWSKDATALEARVSTLNGQIDAQTSKVALLAAEHEKVAAAQGADSRAAQELEIKLNKETATLGVMQKELGETEKNLDEVREGSDNTGESVQEMGNKTQDAANKSQTLKAALGGLAAGAKLAVAALAALAAGALVVAGAVLAMTFNLAAAADELVTLSDKTGISTQRLQEMKFAGEVLGVSLETMTGAHAKLTRAMATAAEGSGAQADAFAALGVKVKDGSGQLRDSEEVFDEVIDKLGKIENPTQRDALAMDILGKSAQELNPLIKAGADGLEDLKEQAHASGAVMSDETIKAAADLQDQLDFLKLGFQGIVGTIAGAFVPGVSGLAGQAQGYLTQLAGIVQSSGGDIGKMVDGFNGLFTKVLEDISKQAPGFFRAGLELVKTLTTSITTALPEMLPAAIEIITSLVNFLVQGAPLIIGAAVKIILTLVGAIVPQLPKLITAAVGIILALVTGLTDAAPQLLPIIATAIAGILQALADNLPTLILAGVQLLTALVQGLTTALPILVEAIPVILAAMREAFKENRVELASAAGELIGVLASAIVQLIPLLIDVCVEVVKQMVVGLSEGLSGENLEALGSAFIGGLVKGVQDGAAGMTESLNLLFDQAWQDGLAGWGNFFTGLGQVFSANWQSGLEGWGRFFTGLGQSFQTGWTNGLTGWRNFFTGLGQSFQNGWNNGIAGWRNFFSGLAQTFQTGWDNGIAGWTNFLQGLVNLVAGFGQTLYSAGTDLIAGFWQGLVDRWNQLIADLGGLIEQLPQAVKDLLGIASPSKVGVDIGGNFGSSIGMGFFPAIEKLRRQMSSAFSGLSQGLTPAYAGGVVQSQENFTIQAFAPINFNGQQGPNSVGAAIRAKRYN